LFEVFLEKAVTIVDDSAIILHEIAIEHLDIFPREAGKLVLEDEILPAPQLLDGGRDPSRQLLSQVLLLGVG
jgi:hypothetical protein